MLAVENRCVVLVASDWHVDFVPCMCLCLASVVHWCVETTKQPHFILFFLMLVFGLFILGVEINNSPNLPRIEVSCHAVARIARCSGGRGGDRMSCLFCRACVRLAVSTKVNHSTRTQWALLPSSCC